jgi:alpha-1,2-mannosyltransferase
VQPPAGRLSRLARLPGRRLARFVLLGILPLFLLATGLRYSWHVGASGSWAIDFNGNLRMPAQEILDGISPYHPELFERVRDAVAAGGSPFDFQRGVFAAYPAPALLLGVPFTLLPQALAEWLWVGLSLASAALALRLVGVRDWRVYGAVMLMPPVVTSLQLGSVDLPLMLGLAACWRWRDHAWRAGAALGAIIALKLLALPLVVFFAATRRWGAAFASLAVSAALCLAGWAAIGFDGLVGYPHLLSLLTEFESERGYSLIHYATALGLGSGVASSVPYVVGGALLVVMWKVARRGGGAEASAFLLCVLAAIALCPIVWQHYLVLMLVPLAVLQPTFSVVWLAPSLLLLTPDGAWIARPRELAIFALVLVVITLPCIGRGRLPQLRDVRREPAL